MEVRLSTDLVTKVDQEVASGRYRNPDELIEQALIHFLEDRQRAQARVDALRSIGRAVEEAGLYEQVLIPGEE